MRKNRPFRLFLLLFLISHSSLLISNLYAQELIALHPFRGPPESEIISTGFFERQRQEIPRVSDSRYMVSPIDLTRLPPDVPEGGFPPWICPSPSITGTASYAITGEAALDPDNPDSFRMRVYLWQLDGARLLGSDEMLVSGIGDLGGVPVFMEWVLSWIDTNGPAEPSVVYANAEPYPPYEQKWLYLGLRGGAGYSRWTYDHGPDYTISDHSIINFFGGNIAFQASLHLTHFFYLQTEANLFADFSPVSNFSTGESDGNYLSLALKVPLLIKFVWKGDHLRGGVFAGAYWHLPLHQIGSDTAKESFYYQADLPGFVGGMNVGWRMGPGNLFLDLRMEYDGHWFSSSKEVREEIHYSNTVRFNIGYEIGFFPKRIRD